jgi:hypothetical protein
MLCDIVPCGKKVTAKKMCQTHYVRVKKHGSPYTLKRNPNPTAVCSEKGCGGKHRSKGYCEKHYFRFYRNETLETVISEPGHKDPYYQVLHLRIGSARGPASSYECVDCGGPAREWSYNHSGIGQYQAWSQATDQYLPASNDIYQYDPRCTRCHKIFDGSRHEGLNKAAV